MTDWRPTARWETLRRRATILGQIRGFFSARGVLEVETPLLSAASVTDLHLRAMSCQVERPEGTVRRYLQTSPEFAMKRLLAAGSGPIFQVSKAFRDGEEGRYHQPELTMLEWYRPGFDHNALMDEMDDLLGDVLGSRAARRETYGSAFVRHLGVDPHRASVDELKAAAERHQIDAVGLEDADRDTWLHLLMSCAVEPELGRGQPTFLVDFPASQAALAQIREGDPPVAERFEVYVEGVELANGYHELTDGAEQRRRFATDLELRRSAGLPTPPVDERLLAALASGMPECAGVALGIDRLVMLAIDAEHIEDVVAFPAARA